MRTLLFSLREERDGQIHIAEKTIPEEAWKKFQGDIGEQFKLTLDELNKALNEHLSQTPATNDTDKQV